MALGKRKYTSRRPRWGKRKVRRTMNISRPSRITRLPSNTLTVKRRIFAGQVTPSNVSTASFWSYVTTNLTSSGTIWTTVLAGLSNYDEYSALFDTYTLKAYKFEFHPRFVDASQPQTYDGTAPLNFTRGYVDIIVDPMNNTTPSGTLTQATYNAFCELGNPKTYRADKKFSVYIKPKVQEQYGGGFNRYVSPKPTDITSPGLVHRGFHMFCRNQNMNGVNLPQFDVYVTYYLQFKGKR